MYAPRPPRSLAAAASLGLVALLGLILVFGLQVRTVLHQVPALVSVAITPPPSPPVEKPKPRPPSPKSAPTGNPAPENIRNKATQIVAPPVPVVLKPPPPVVTAPEAGVGAASNTGASDRPGPGTGAGGIGNGDGGGGNGGDGDGGGPVIGPRRIRGDMRYEDLPKGVLRDGEEATVEVIYMVEADGRASNCRARRSSGHQVLDAVACRLIEQRFRFRPAQDARGRPVRAGIVENHTWVEDSAPVGRR